jgi:hypothetical protein
MLLTIIKAFAAAILMSIFASFAHADILTFNLSYSGVSLGNNAVATGNISFDDTILSGGPISLGNVSAMTLGITDFSITISGASSGNGTFGLADQLGAGQENGWIWVLGAPIDLTTELVGQSGFNDFNWCAGSLSCGNPLSPGGYQPFSIATSGETGDRLILTSMNSISPVPEPETYATLLVGLGLIVFMARRRKQSFTA